MKRPVVSLLVVFWIFVFVMHVAADPVMEPVIQHYDFMHDHLTNGSCDNYRQIADQMSFNTK